MKKSNFIALILGTIGVAFFAIGMCMCMLPEWNMFRQGIVSGIIGLIVLLADVMIWRKLEGKEPIKISGKMIMCLLIGIIGALLLGVGMCLSMVFGRMLFGIIIGLIGIVILLMLIPLTKGIHD